MKETKIEKERDSDEHAFGFLNFTFETIFVYCYVYSQVQEWTKLNLWISFSSYTSPFINKDFNQWVDLWPRFEKVLIFHVCL